MTLVEVRISDCASNVAEDCFLEESVNKSLACWHSSGVKKWWAKKTKAAPCSRRAADPGTRAMAETSGAPNCHA
eukprot:5436710-Prymnesium_polylepis.1